VAQVREGRTVRCTPQFGMLNQTLAFVKEHCCAGFDELAARPKPESERRRRRRSGAA
jgi:hypothetical protein